VRVFLGVTGASGAAYAARLLEALTEADCEVGVCISGAGLEVIATELYGDARLSRDETIARFTEHARGEVRYSIPRSGVPPTRAARRRSTPT
jgi:3-polyprenyl-4-hydroxybenzoate decarboxylase